MSRVLGDDQLTGIYRRITEEDTVVRMIALEKQKRKVALRQSLINAGSDLPGKPGRKLKTIADSDQKTILPDCQSIRLDTNEQICAEAIWTKYHSMGSEGSR
jgi:hypothetical protein